MSRVNECVTSHYDWEQRLRSDDVDENVLISDGLSIINSVVLTDAYCLV